MRSPLPLSLALLALTTALLAPACGSDGSTTSTSGTPDADDGKFHPPGNEMPMSEADACNALTMAQQQDFMHLDPPCASTTRVCPDFLRSQFGMDCLQYDQGTVQGCLQYYSDQKTCMDLSKAIDHCAISSIAGSAGKGCM